jgi:hypothetical protein
MTDAERELLLLVAKILTRQGTLFGFTFWYMLPGFYHKDLKALTARIAAEADRHS